MRRKAIIITCCVTGAVAVLIILGVLLFSIKQVTVESYPRALQPSDYDAVVQSTDYVLGGSILFLDEERLIQQVTSAHPSIQVLGIERKFPSSVVVHVLPKYEYAYVEVGEKYLVVDNDLRVLREAVEKPNLVLLKSSDLNVTGAEIGQPLATADGAFERVAAATFMALARIGYDVTDVKDDLTDLIEYVDIDVSVIGNEKITLLMKSKTVIKILRAESDLRLFNAKVRLALTTYVQVDGYKGEGKEITAFTQDGQAVVTGKK